jgi:hypothetical protein
VEVKSGGSASVFDVASGQAIGSVTLPATGAIAHTGAGFSPDGKYLVTVTAEPVARQTPAG